MKKPAVNANLLNLLNFMMPQASTNSPAANNQVATNSELSNGLFAQQLSAILGNLENQSIKNIDITDQLIAKFANANPDQPLILDNFDSIITKTQANQILSPEFLAQQLEFAIAQILKQLTSGQTTTDQMPNAMRALFSSMLEQLKRLELTNPTAPEPQIWMSIKVITVAVQPAEPQKIKLVETESQELVKTKSSSTNTWVGDGEIWFKVRVTVISLDDWQNFTKLQSITNNGSQPANLPECIPVSLLKANPNLVALPTSQVIEPATNLHFEPTSNLILEPIATSGSIKVTELTKTQPQVTLLEQIKELAPQMKLLNGELEIVIDKTQPEPVNPLKTTEATTNFKETSASTLLLDPISEPVEIVNQPVKAETQTARLITIEPQPVTEVAEDVILQPKTELIEPPVLKQFDDKPIIKQPAANVQFENAESQPTDLPPKALETPVFKDTTINSSINTPKPNIQPQPQPQTQPQTQNNPQQLNTANPQPSTLSFDQVLTQAKPAAPANQINVNPNVNTQPPITVQPNTVNENVIKPLMTPQPLDVNPNIPESLQPETVKPLMPSSPLPPVTKLTDIPHTELKLTTLMNTLDSTNNIKQPQFGHNLTLPPTVDEFLKFSGLSVFKPSLDIMTARLLTQEPTSSNAHHPTTNMMPAKRESSALPSRELPPDPTVLYAPRIDVEWNHQRRTLNEAVNTLRQELVNLQEQVQGDTRASSPVREITFKLDPPNLGEMTARMQVKGGELIVHLQVANNQTRDLLERELQTLRAQLKELGVAGAQIKVELHSERHGQSHQHSHGELAQQAHSDGSGNRQQSNLTDEQLPESVIQANSIWALLEPNTTTVGVNLYNDPNAKYI